MTREDAGHFAADSSRSPLTGAQRDAGGMAVEVDGV